MRRGYGVEEIYLAQNDPVSQIVLLYPGVYGPPRRAGRSRLTRPMAAGGSGGAGFDVGGGVGASMYLELTQATLVLPT